MAEAHAGRVAELWRYPVKSMRGEMREGFVIGPRGVHGDRAYALVDADTGKVASAKDPRRWPAMFGCAAALTAEPASEAEAPTPPARITLPDGAALTTDDPDAEARLAAAVGRPVRLARAPIGGAAAEGFWPDVPWLPAADRGQTFTFPLPPGTFFDGALVHLLTTATLARLAAHAPASRFAVARFRPNLVIEPTGEDEGFVEDAWIGRTLAVGGAVLRVEGPCPRCIMTTLAQGDLPRDPDVLRAAVQANGGNVGVYATVVRPGAVRRGDPVAAA